MPHTFWAPSTDAGPTILLTAVHTSNGLRLSSNPVSLCLKNIGSTPEAILLT